LHHIHPPTLVPTISPPTLVPTHIYRKTYHLVNVPSVFQYFGIFKFSQENIFNFVYKSLENLP
jgi:hypothetical protein